jgi:hypothetical protein
VGGLSWDTHGITEDEDKKAQGAGKRHPKGVYVRAATFHVIGMIHPGLRVRAPGCLRVSFHFSFSSAPQLVLISTLITTRTRKGGVGHVQNQHHHPEDEHEVRLFCNSKL